MRRPFPPPRPAAGPAPFPPQPVPGPFAVPDFAAVASPPPPVSEPAVAAPVFPNLPPVAESDVNPDLAAGPPPLVVEAEPPVAPHTYTPAVSPETVPGAERARESFPGTLTPPSPPQSAEAPPDSNRGLAGPVPTGRAPRTALTPKEPCLACGTLTATSALSSGTSPWGGVP